MMPNVAIVYLSYNGISYLDEVIAALRALDYPKDRLELIVVDNASHDGSQDYLRNVEGVTLFLNEENVVFAEGNNIGMRHAIEQGAVYVFLHNNDLILDPAAIKESVACAESDPSIGSVQSLMLLWKHRDIVNSTGGMIHFLGFGFVRDNGKKWEHCAVQDRETIAYASGAAVLYRVRVLQEIGLLDPFLFLYHEDLELGWRIRLAGYRNVLSINSRAYHDYEFKRSVSKFFWMERNRWLVHFSHLKWPTLILLVPWMLLLEFPLMVFAVVGGWGTEKFRVYRALLQPRCWNYVAQKRKQSQQIRRVTDRVILSEFTSKIQHQETSSVVVDSIGNPVLTRLWRCIYWLVRW